MSVVRRGSAGVVVAGLVLLGGPAWAQEQEPCAPGPDGSVPEMCQSGTPVSDTGTVGMEPEQPCPAQPVEPGDGVVVDEGIAVGEPPPGEPAPDPVPEGDPKAEPAPDEAPTLVAPLPGDAGADTVICAFAVPVSAPVADGAPESAAGGGVTAAEQLPRTGPDDRLLALTALGSGLVVAGAGAVAAGRRRRTPSAG